MNGGGATIVRDVERHERKNGTMIAGRMSGGAGLTGARSLGAWTTRVVRALAIGSLLLVAACQAELYSGQTDRSVNEMIAVLSANGIEAKRVAGSEDGRFGLTVPRRDFARAVTILSEKGLPRQQYGGLGQAFTGDKIVSTPFEERARFMYAISQDLTQAITKIAGVTDASVHVNVPESQPLSDQPIASSASVFIYRDPSYDLRSQVPTIKTLITNTVDGLEYENVEVAVFDARSPAAAPVLSARRGLSVPALVGYGVLALVGIVLWRKLTGRKPANRRLTARTAGQRGRAVGTVE